jgi:rhodanese-related sulfurtransferase
MRRTNSIWPLLALFIVIAASPFAVLAEGFTVISKDQLKEELGRPDVVIIDVRAPHDWDTTEWKIQGAQRQAPAEAKEWMGKYPKDKTIALYCA